MKKSVTKKKTEVKAVRVSLICECGGEMLPGGVVYMTHPPRYPHKCSRCDNTTVEGSSYPKIEYEDINPNKGVD